jgi:hypothetical protein
MAGSLGASRNSVAPIPLVLEFRCFGVGDGDRLVSLLDLHQQPVFKTV